MQSLTTALSRTLARFDDEASKGLRNAENNRRFEAALRKTWKENPAAADYLLSHINGVFVGKDTALRKGPGKDKPLIYFGMYCDDSTTKAELNARREWLKMAMAHEGMKLDEIRLFAATSGMRDRHPFACSAPAAAQAPSTKAACAPVDEATIDKTASAVDDPLLAQQLKRAMEATVGAQAAQATATPQQGAAANGNLGIQDESRLLEALKRAVCQAYGDYERAQALLARIEGAELEEIPPTARTRTHRARYRCFLYVQDPAAFSHALAATRATVLCRAKELGLLLYDIRVRQSPASLEGMQAFPPCGNPVPLRAHRPE